jgi:mono/diheme cytochrome c family protein
MTNTHHLSRRIAALAFAIAMGMFSTLGLAAAETPPPDQTGGVDLASPAVIERGMQLLNSACGGYCHGSEGRGLKAPSLRNRTDLTWKSIHATVTYGRKRAGKMMPAWKGSLPDEDIWAAVAAVLSLQRVDGDAASAPKPATH